MIRAMAQRWPLTGFGPTHVAPRLKLTATALPAVRLLPDASTVWNRTARNPSPTTSSGRIDSCDRPFAPGAWGR